MEEKDKKALDKLFKKNEINKIKCKYLINDFITLLQFLNDLKKDRKDTDLTEESHISEALELIKENVSEDFFLIFNNKKSKENELVIKKTIEIFKYFLKIIYTSIKEDIKTYQEELEDEVEDLYDDKFFELKDKKEKLDDYFNKKNLITKKDLASAIQLFISLSLFREKDKKNKIKLNIHNIINYLKVPDFWDNKIYNDVEFLKNLYELRTINIQINQIIWLYNYLIDYKESNKDKDIESKKKEKKSEIHKKEFGKMKKVISFDNDTIELNFTSAKNNDDENDE